VLNDQGLPGWFPDDFAADPRMLEAMAGGPIDFAGDALAVELGWRFDPLEKRDAHGRWTRDGKGYVAPDHDRLVLPHAPRNSRFPFYKAPEDHPFFAAHPVSHKNIVASYDASTPGEREQGMRWYSDAGLLAKAIAHGDQAKGAGMLASYSPQAPWPANMFNAARSLELGRAIGHEEGMITHSMQDHAQRILDGEPNDKVFTKNSAPKIRAFAHLIEHGGDEPDEQLGHVVIDRHAMSVAMGTRLPKKEADTAPIGTDRYYQHVADQYRLAALEISKRGEPITPHQVQAITWLHQQSANALEDAAGAGLHGGKGAGKGRQVMQRNAWLKWNKEAAAEHLPVHQGTTALSNSIFGQVYDLAGWEGELRDSRGRWTKFGGVGKAADVMSRNQEGFIVSVRSGSQPAHGFMVAQLDHTHTYPASILDDHAQLTRAIDDMLVKEKSAFQGQDTYLGGWVHDGKLWLEPSDNLADREHAVSEGRSRNQIAVWDVDHGQEIGTGGTGGGRIYEHANPEGGHGADPGGLRGAPGGRAAGYRGPAGGRPTGIAGQLELAGWATAWLHEHRAADGRWVRGAGDEVSDMSKRIRDEWHKAMDREIVQHLNRASASLDAEDYGAAAAEMAKAAYRSMDKADPDLDAARRYLDISDDLMRYASPAGKTWEIPGEEPDDRPDVSQVVHDQLLRTSNRISKQLGGSTEAWTGRATTFPPVTVSDAEGNVGTLLGDMQWSGSMELAEPVAKLMEDVAAHPDTPITAHPENMGVPYHELLHGLIPQGQSYRDHAEAYQDRATADIEEGFTELGTIQHMPEELRAASLDKVPTEEFGSGSNPEMTVKRDMAIQDAKVIAARIREIVANDNPTGQQQLLDAARRITAGADSAKAYDDWLVLYDGLHEAQHSGVPEIAHKVRELKQRLSEIHQMDEHPRLTLGQFWERLQNPDRIAAGDVAGIYPYQTSMAWDWISQIAADELKGKPIPEGYFDRGHPGWIRATQLSDEINREGPGQKLTAMARQVARNALKGGPDEKLLDDPATMNRIIRQTTRQIRAEWKGNEGAKAAFRAAHNAARDSARDITAGVREQ
jgi:hypothetical protein